MNHTSTSIRCIFPLFNFFFNDTATTEIYTLSLHDALPISETRNLVPERVQPFQVRRGFERSEEHTSELQSPYELVCRLLLEKKKIKDKRRDAKKRQQEGTYIQYSCQRN